MPRKLHLFVELKRKKVVRKHKRTFSISLSRRRNLILVKSVRETASKSLFGGPQAIAQK